MSIQHIICRTCVSIGPPGYLCGDQSSVAILVNARLALCLASDGVLSLPIRVTMVALLSNSFCQTNAGTQETDFQLLFYSIWCSIIRFRRSIIRCLRLFCNIMGTE